MAGSLKTSKNENKQTAKGKLPSYLVLWKKKLNVNQSDKTSQFAVDRKQRRWIEAPPRMFYILQLHQSEWLEGYHCVFQ